MNLFLDFTWRFTLALAYASPLLISFILIIVVLALLIGKKEGWTRLDAMYFAFITATTVGFGDLNPKTRLSRLLSIVVAMLGLIFTGIIIAIAIHAADYAFRHSPEFTEALRKFGE
jgi:voltage-gated potassium channel